MKIFLAGGESRHWLNAPLIEAEHEDISRRRVLLQYGERNQADCMGGIVPDVRDESILSRCNDRRQLAEVSRDLYSEWGGYG